MDPVTHGLTGALIAEAGFSQRLGGRSRLVLTAAAMFPDIDIVYRFGGLPTYIENHRGLTHSFAGLFAAGMILGSILGRLDEERRYVAWIAACWVALFSHLLLDLITSYGTVALYPFSRTRFYFDWVFIIDVFLSGLLLLFLILSRRSQSGVRLARTGLLAACGYIGFCALNHSLALHQLRQSAAENQIAYQSIAVIPQLGAPVRWSGILDAGTDYYQIPFYSFQKPQSPFQVFNKTRRSFFEQKARETELGVLYYWFARYPVVDEYEQQGFHIVEFSDLRFYIRVYSFFVRRPFVLRIKMDSAGNVLESRFARS